MRTFLESDLSQPAGSFRLSLLPSLSPKQQRHGNIFYRREFRQQVVKLPYEARFPIAKFRSFVVRKRIQSQVGAVYVTCGSAIKGTQDVQKCTLSRSGFSHDGEHFSSFYLKRQILKEHQIRLAGPENFLQAFYSKHSTVIL